MKIFNGNYWKSNFAFVRAAWNGLKLLVEAVSLLATSGATVYLVTHYELLLWIERSLLASALVIGLRGAVEFIRHMARMANPKVAYRANSK